MYSYVTNRHACNASVQKPQTPVHQHSTGLSKLSPGGMLSSSV